MQHETGHLSQINDMGAAKFYGRTAREYTRHLFSKNGFLSVYTTPGTLEYATDFYAFQRLDYYYSNYYRNFRFTFP